MIRTIYGFDDLGRKVPVGSYDDGYNPVGGRIFYIDSNSDETVEFYDANRNIISNVAVGDTPAYYKVISAGVSGKDKYYIYNSSIGSDKKWSYYHITTGAVDQNIGTGRLNTSTIINIEDTTGYSSQSIWTWLKQYNLSNSNGISDWYIGSKDEMEQLRLYLVANADGTTIINFFNINYVWCSSENTNPYGDELAFAYQSSGWYALQKNSDKQCCAIRSF